MKNKLSERLKKLRKDSEISQAKLGVILNVPQQTYDRWEQGYSQPSIETLIQLANYFDVTVDYLIGNSNDMYAGDKQKPNSDEMAMALDNSSIAIKGHYANIHIGNKRK